MGSKPTTANQGVLSEAHPEPGLRIVCTGPRGAGKTEILMRMKIEFGEPDRYDSGLVVSKGRVKRLEFVSWDSGAFAEEGRDVKKYMVEAKALIYVLDVSKREELEARVRELEGYLAGGELEGCTVMVWANKRDLLGAGEEGQAVEYLKGTLAKKERVKIVACSALAGDGVLEGVEWLERALSTGH
jgi:GTPase SAR1 family protein